MAKAIHRTSTDRLPLSEAYALLVKAYGAPQQAEGLLREKFAPDRNSWGYWEKTGDAPDDDLWRSARFKFAQSSARVGVTVLFVGPGVGRDSDLRSTEWLGIWVLRTHMFELLPSGPAEGDTPAKQWLFDEVADMKLAGEIPSKITPFSRTLEARMRDAAKVDCSIRPLKARTLENMLRDCKLWPVTPSK